MTGTPPPGRLLVFLVLTTLLGVSAAITTSYQGNRSQFSNWGPRNLLVVEEGGLEVEGRPEDRVGAWDFSPCFNQTCTLGSSGSARAPGGFLGQPPSSGQQLSPKSHLRAWGSWELAPAEAGWGRFKVVAIALDWLMKATHCTLPRRETARTRYTHVCVAT